MPPPAPLTRTQVAGRTKQQARTSGKATVPQIWSVADGRLRLSFHPGQTRVWQSQKRFQLMLAGTQGGKTSFGPWWLWREIQRHGSADYLCVTSSYDLFKLKLLPVMRETFESILGIGRYWSGAGVIELRDPDSGEFWADRSDSKMWGRIILRSAASRGGLESTTAAAAWLDEAGQEAFNQETWEAVLRRLSLYQGRALVTTTLYQTTGWLRVLYDAWQAGDPNTDIIQFDSTKNPAFTQQEYDRARSTMAEWRFNLFYRGRFINLPGQIYVLPPTQRISRFALPLEWPRYVGVDFGAINTALVWLAHNPHTDCFYIYRESLTGNQTTAEHCADALKFVSATNADGSARTLEHVMAWYGGSGSERQQRMDWNDAGVPVMRPPVDSVEAGLDRVTSLIKTGKLFVFDDLDGILKEFQTYSRQMNDQGDVFESIRDKASYHRLDATRYVCTALSAGPVTYAPSPWD